MLNTKRSAIAAAVATIAGATALTFGAIADGAPANPPQPPQSHAKIFGTNAQGKTFGSGDVVDPKQLPDFVGVIATNGKEGFIKKDDFRTQPMTLDQVRKLPTEVIDGKKVFVAPSRLVPVYASDGTTVIGQFRASLG